VRDQGYAENKEEHVRGIQSVGAAIVDGDATPIGGISVSRTAYQADEVSDDDDLPQRIVAAANNIELNLRYQD
jgi:DNA-binding IclR family transcriptional regulator